MAGAAIGSAIAGLMTNIAEGSRADPAEEAIREAMELLARVREPNFDFRQLTPAQLQVVSQWDPEFYEAVVPDEVKLIAESAARSDQIGALEAVKQIAAEGLPLADRLAAERSTDAIAQEATRAQDAILENLAARGRLGGGAEVAARMVGDQSLSQMRGEMGRGLAEEALQRRLAALGQQAGMAGDIRGQDFARSARNADLINNFNQYVANVKTRQAQNRADLLNRQREYEAGERQRVSDFNRLEAADTEAENLQRWNALQSELGDFRLRKAGAQQPGYSALSESLRATDAARRLRNRELAQGVGSAVGGLMDYWRAGSSEEAEPSVTARDEMDRLYRRY